MIESRHPLSKSFGFAFEGLKAAFTKGRNFRIQITVGVIACLLGFLVHLDSSEWLDLAIVITMVLILELVNTSIEALVDLTSPEIQAKAKLAKDVAAATVLVASIGSIIVGALLFLPKLMLLI